MHHDPESPAPVPGGQADAAAQEPVATPRSASDVEPTGVDAVDQVLAEVAAVADAPVSAHVETFERAHEQLRRALDAPPVPADDGQRGV